MVLRITNNDKEYDNRFYYKLSLFDFSQKEYHPFIATQTWDRVDIDLCDETPGGIIGQLVSNTRVVPIFDVVNVSPKVLSILCEIVPRDRAKLRALYKSDREAFYKLLQDLVSQYRWTDSEEFGGV